MFGGVLYQTIFIAVHGAGRSLVFAAPLAVFAAVAAYANYRFTLPLEALLAFFIVFLGLLSVYIVAALRAMLHPEAPPSFREAVLFRRTHVDFLAFSAATFIVVGILIFALIYTVTLLYGYIGTLEENARPAEGVAEYGYGEGGATLFLFGSRFFTIAFLMVAVVLWSRFFRIFIKMPAYIDGFEMSSSEALDLTAPYRRHILIMSTVLNAVFWTITSILPWEESALWVRYLMGGCAVWGGVHLNLAFSVAAYRYYTEGYSMRKSHDFLPPC